MYEIDPKNSTFLRSLLENAPYYILYTILDASWITHKYTKETGTRRIGTGACHFVVRGLPDDYFFSAAAFSCSAFSIFSGVMGISVKRQPVAL